MGIIIAGILVLSLWLLALAGYISNIVYVVNAESFINTNEQLLATVGVCVAPLGSLHGIYTWF